VYFEKLLTDNSYPHLVIYIKDMKYWELQALVTFMYNGEVSVNQNKLASLVKAAESLKIKGLAPDSSFQDDISEKIDEDDIEEYHIGTKHGNESNSKEEKQSLLRYRSPPKQLKRKVMTAPPKLVKMQKIERQTNGGFGINMKQESHPPSDDDESFPHETAESSEVGVKDEEAEDDMESLEVSLNPVDEGSGDGHSSPSDVEESQTPNAGGIRSRFAYKYGKEIRDSALAALSSGMSLRQCSEAFGIPRKTLSKWKNRAPSVTPEENAGETEEDGGTVVARRPSAVGAPAGTVQDGGDRAERLQKAMELAVSGVTVRQAAAHFDIPRTTLCAYMKRRGVAPKRNFLPSSTPTRKIGGSSGGGSGKAAQSVSISQFEDFPFLGISEMMDEMGQGSYSAEDQK
jgi:transposase-like protein